MLFMCMYVPLECVMAQGQITGDSEAKSGQGFISIVTEPRGALEALAVDSVQGVPAFAKSAGHIVRSSARAQAKDVSGRESRHGRIRRRIHFGDKQLQVGVGDELSGASSRDVCAWTSRCHPR
jgi:hypothetical protein